MTENCGDIYGSYTWGNLTWNGAEYDEHYNVFKYTFPEFTQVNMVNPRSWRKKKTVPNGFARTCTEPLRWAVFCGLASPAAFARRTVHIMTME